MSSIERPVKTLVRYMYYVAGAALVLMMVITCVDIVLRLSVTLYARYGWEVLSPFQPLPGTYELVCFLGSTAAAFAMAHTLVESGHVAVSVLVRLFSEKTQAVFQIVTSSMAFIFFGLLSWQSVVYAQKLKKWGEVSMTLELPYYPFVYGMALSAAAVCLVLLVTVISEGGKVGGK
ncbi:MAG: TRAP transporter small permease [Deltaproteobacteria bacterium]|nr:TRAP transporter small permease [Deltaproteobacteria bacterium]